MSADKFTLFYCLTETGWLSPTEHEDVPLPDHWVRTYEVKVYQGSGFGEQSEDWRLSQTNESKTEVEIASIEEMYPRPKKQMSILSPALENWFRKTGS
jgi:hypothetical protein